MTNQPITTVFSNDVFQTPANFSHARVVNGLVYASAQIPLGLDGKLVGDTIEEQTAQVLKNQKAIVEAAGSSFDRLLRVNVFLVESSDYAGFSSVYSKVGTYTSESIGSGRLTISLQQLIPDPKPPRGCVFVKGLPAGAKIEIDLIAFV